MNTAVVENSFAKLLFLEEDRIDLYDTIADFIESGAGPIKATEKMMEQLRLQKKSERDSQMIILKDINFKLKRGDTFSSAISEWVPPIELTLIETSEKTGSVNHGLKQVISFIDGSSDQKSMWIGVVLYPVFLIFGMLLLMNMYGQEILPQFAMLQPVDSWSKSGQVFYYLCMWVVHWKYALAVAMVIAVILVGFSLPRLVGPVRAFLDYVPPWSFYKKDIAIAFTGALIAQVKSGTKEINALKNIYKNSPPYLRSMIEPLVELVGRGRSMGAAMIDLGGRFPDPKLVSLIMLHNGNSSFVTKFPEQFDRWVNRRAKRMKAMAKVSGLVMMLLSALAMAAIYLTLSDISQSVASHLMSH